MIIVILIEKHCVTVLAEMPFTYSIAVLSTPQIIQFRRVQVVKQINWIMCFGLSSLASGCKTGDQAVRPVVSPTPSQLTDPKQFESKLKVSLSTFEAIEHSGVFYHGATWSEDSPGVSGRLLTYGGWRGKKPGEAEHGYDESDKLYAFDPVNQTTHAIDAPGLRALIHPNLVATSDGVYIWGGATLDKENSGSYNFEYLYDAQGIFLNPSSGEKREISANGAPSPRHQPFLHVLSRRFLLFGGYDAKYSNSVFDPIGRVGDDRFLFNGAIYDPENDSWSGTSPFTYPDCEGAPTVLGSDGESLMMWGVKSKTGNGCATRFDLALYRYDLTSSEWSAIEVEGAPDLPFATEVTGSLLGDKLWVAWANPRDSNELTVKIHVAYIDLKVNQWIPVGSLDFEGKISLPFRTLATNDGLLVLAENECGDKSKHLKIAAGIIGTDGSTSITTHVEETWFGYYCENGTKGESLTLTPAGVIGWGGAFKSDKYYGFVRDTHRLFSFTQSDDAQ